MAVTKGTLLSWFLITLTILTGQLRAEDSLLFHRETRIRFVPRAVAAQWLPADDEFTREMTAVDRQLRLQSDEVVTAEQYRQFVAEQVTDWPADEQRRVMERLATLRPLVQSLPALWPPEILFIKGSSRLEGGAAHCRANAVVLPTGAIPDDDTTLDGLLLHELFHILSRQSVARQRAMYRLLGFESVESIQLPASLAARKLTNPDAPRLNCVLTLATRAGESVTVTPILLANQAQYPDGSRRTLFGELSFRLLEVQAVDDGTWQAHPTDMPRLYEPEELPSFFTKIGRNTGYIIHPEEVLADNFVYLVRRTPGLADPQIPEQLRGILEQKAP